MIIPITNYITITMITNRAGNEHNFFHEAAVLTIKTPCINVSNTSNNQSFLLSNSENYLQNNDIEEIQ